MGKAGIFVKSIAEEVWKWICLVDRKEAGTKCLTPRNKKKSMKIAFQIL